MGSEVAECELWDLICTTAASVLNSRVMPDSSRPEAVGGVDRRGGARANEFRQ